MKKVRTWHLGSQPLIVTSSHFLNGEGCFSPSWLIIPNNLWQSFFGWYHIFHKISKITPQNIIQNPNHNKVFPFHFSLYLGPLDHIAPDGIFVSLCHVDYAVLDLWVLRVNIEGVGGSPPAGMTHGEQRLLCSKNMKLQKAMEIRVTSTFPPKRYTTL